MNKKLLLTTLLLLLLGGCKKNMPVVERKINILVVSNDTVEDRNGRKTTYVVLNTPDQSDMLLVRGSPDCLLTHEVKVGNTYGVKLKFKMTGEIQPVNNLCLITALIKQGEN